MNTVLIVDDSAVSRLFIKSHWQKVAPNTEFIEASSAKEALEKYQGLDLYAISLDYNMPGEMKGLELAAQLKKQLPKTYLFMLTANVQRSTRDEAEQIGVHFYCKPVTEALLKTISSDCEVFHARR